MATLADNFRLVQILILGLLMLLQQFKGTYHISKLWHESRMHLYSATAPFDRKTGWFQYISTLILILFVPQKATSPKHLRSLLDHAECTNTHVTDFGRRVLGGTSMAPSQWKRTRWIVWVMMQWAMWPDESSWTHWLGENDWNNSPTSHQSSRFEAKKLQQVSLVGLAYNPTWCCSSIGKPRFSRVPPGALAGMIVGFTAGITRFVLSKFAEGSCEPFELHSYRFSDYSQRWLFGAG